MSRVVVITGTRKGIGKFLTEYFLSIGDTVYGCSRNESSLANSRYFHTTLDVSDQNAVTSMVRKIYKENKKIDILINNAGIASMNHFILTPFETAQNIMNTNYFGTFLMCREVGKIMSKQRMGRIINFSTVAVPTNLEGELAYASSKAAVEQLTKTLAVELGENGITVNAVGPTPVKTDLVAMVSPEKLNKLIEKQSIKRFGEFADVLNVVKFFIDQQSSFITGQIIYLGGIN